MDIRYVYPFILRYMYITEYICSIYVYIYNLFTQEYIYHYIFTHLFKDIY